MLAEGMIVREQENGGVVRLEGGIKGSGKGQSGGLRFIARRLGER